MTTARLSFLRGILASRPRISALAYHLTDNGDHERPVRMSESGPRKIRDTANTLLDAFVRTVEKAYEGRPVSPVELQRIADTLKISHDFDGIYDKAFADLQTQAVA